jgi:hypothetical protein
MFLNLFYYYITVYYTNIILRYHKIGEKRALSGRAEKRVIPLLHLIIS